MSRLPTALEVDGADATELQPWMRQVVAELELVSHGKTQSYEASTTHGEIGHVVLTADREGYPHLAFVRRWNSCGTDRARRAVLKDALDQLDQYRRGTAVSKPEPRTYDWRIKIAHSTQPIKVLAREWNVSEAYVKKLRAEYRHGELQRRLGLRSIAD